MLQFRIVQTGTFEMTTEAGVTENRPTCSLIESNGWYVLIDLDHPANNSNDLITSLSFLGVKPQQINVVIFTHLHPDHIGHKDLFPNALFMFHQDEKLSYFFKNNRTLKLNHDVVYKFSENCLPCIVKDIPDFKRLHNSIYIRHCPGHTEGSLCIFAFINELIHAFAGDIFLFKEYYDKWQLPGMSWDYEKLFRQMQFIKENADVIIPGHGEPFRI